MGKGKGRGMVISSHVSSLAWGEGEGDIIYHFQRIFGRIIAAATRVHVATVLMVEEFRDIQDCTGAMVHGVVSGSGVSKGSSSREEG